MNYTRGKITVLDRHQNNTYLFLFHAKRATVRVRVRVVVRFGSFSTRDNTGTTEYYNDHSSTSTLVCRHLRPQSTEHKDARVPAAGTVRLVCALPAPWTGV